MVRAMTPPSATEADEENVLGVVSQVLGDRQDRDPCPAPS